MPFTYDTWMEEQGIPVHRGYYIQDLRDVELAPWDMRKINAAFMQLRGMEGVVESRIEEIPPGATLEPLKMAVDEMVYVLNGRGVASVWADGSSPKKTFEWSTRSLFLIPRNNWCQLGNMDGGKPVRLLHYNYLPLAMSAVPDPDFFFNNPYTNAKVLNGNGDFYSEAVAELQKGEGRFAETGRQVWRGNFFPDMAAWDKLVPFWGRGAGGRVVFIQTPGSEMRAHMSVFPERSYKKGHRHGPGRVIVIPGGEGYSVMWPDENAEKVVVHWHEASCFVPPDRWFHQHFNLGTDAARYLALHPPAQFMGMSEKVEDRARDQIEYPQEDPWIREYFESELAKRGMASAIPAEAYRDPDFEWDYSQAV